MLEAHRFDLVITDVLMPEQGGLHMCKHLSADKVLIKSFDFATSEIEGISDLITISWCGHLA